MSRLGVPILAQIIGGFVVLDFSFGYLAHRTMHGSPTLWRAHRVHHSDPFVDATTTFRNHPIEGLWRFLFLIVPIWVLGVPAEAVALQRLLTVINGSLEHANIRVWPPLDRVLSLIWVTPNMHKVHHSRDRAETDSNYGNILSIYDRIFRTFTPTDRARFGDLWARRRGSRPSQFPSDAARDAVPLRRPAGGNGGRLVTLGSLGRARRAATTRPGKRNAQPRVGRGRK
jgi:sterol desaturase/sphingolipid hydroxylase (fatty acid hydroxylase superfamily)